MTTRRNFMTGMLAFPFAKLAYGANQQIGYPGPMGIPRKAWVQQPQLVQQNCQLWCWAASIAMIFDSAGHPMDQTTIVQATFGAVACLPSGNTATIGQNLSRAWVDSNGVAFQSNVVAAYDPSNGINNLSNNVIVDELTQDRPLLYCNSHHAMVLVSVDYFDTPYGPDLRAGGVLDPWPYSPGFHPLTYQEMFPNLVGGQMTFLAAVQVY